MILKKCLQKPFYSLVILASFLICSSAFGAAYNYFNIQLSTLAGNTHSFTYKITPQNGAAVSNGSASSSIDNTAKQISISDSKNDVISATLNIYDGAKNIYTSTVKYTKSAGSLSQTITNLNMSGTSFSSKPIAGTETTAPTLDITLKATN